MADSTRTRIFISYRRDDSAATVGRIYDRLVARFGRDAIFKDVDSIPPGVDFEAFIRSMLAECAVQLVVVGPLWLELKVADGRRRIDVPGDYVRMEIEAALAQGLPIIPLLVQGAGMPHSAQLPPSIQELARYNGLLVRYDPDFENDMRRVVAAVERWLGEAAPQAPPPAPGDVAGRLLAEMRQSFAASDWPDAVRKGDLLIRTMPQAASAEVYRLLGMAALELRDDKRASDALNVANQKQPLHVPTMRALARARLHLGQPAEAAQVLADALAVAGSAERLAILGEYAEALVALKRWGDLLASADEALRLAPDDPAWLAQRLRALTELGRQPEALAVARTLTARPEATAAQWLARARLEVDMRRYDDAQASLAAAQRLAPGDAAVARTRAELFPLPEVPQRLAQLGFRGANLTRTPVILPPVVPVPAGEFLMGSDKKKDRQAYDDELPQHRVTLPAYQIAKFPVTVAEYACFVRAGQSQPQNWASQLGRLDHPVVYVSWRDATAYAAWLAKLTGQPWRLPTEAEWEKAARGTDGRIYPWGNGWDKSRANTSDGGPGTTTPVGQYPSGGSPYGALDMAGNVWEWTSTLMKAYPYKTNDGREQQESTGNRVLRGGSWGNNPQVARAARRGVGGPDGFFRGRGFRVLLAAAPGS